MYSGHSTLQPPMGLWKCGLRLQVQWNPKFNYRSEIHGLIIKVVLKIKVCNIEGPLYRNRCVCVTVSNGMCVGTLFM